MRFRISSGAFSAFVVIASASPALAQNAPATTDSATPAPSAEPAPDATAAPAAEPAATQPQAADAEDVDDGTSKKKKKKNKDRGDEEPEAPAPLDEADEESKVEGDPWDNTASTLRGLGLNFRFLMQARYRHTFPATSKSADPFYRQAELELARNGDGWDINRGFFGVSAEPSKYLAVKMVLDVAELRHNKPKKVVKQAYVELRPLPKHLHFAAGILKIPYSIHELDAIARYEFASSGDANAMISDFGFGGRDIGAEVIVSPFSKPRYLTLSAGVFRGHANDETASPIGVIAARLETQPIKGFRVGGGIVSQPQTSVDLSALNTSGKDLLPNPTDPLYPRARTWQKGNAYGVDLTFQRGPLRLRAEGLLGDRVDFDSRYGATQWAAAWATAAYRFDLGLIAIEPALRVEFFDSDFKRDAGLHREFSFALGTHVYKSTKLVVDVTRMDIQDNTPVIDQPLPLRAVPFNALSYTRATVQLQVAL